MFCPRNLFTNTRSLCTLLSAIPGSPHIRALSLLKVPSFHPGYYKQRERGCVLWELKAVQRGQFLHDWTCPGSGMQIRGLHCEVTATVMGCSHPSARPDPMGWVKNQIGPAWAGVGHQCVQGQVPADLITHPFLLSLSQTASLASLGPVSDDCTAQLWPSVGEFVSLP